VPPPDAVCLGGPVESVLRRITNLRRVMRHGVVRLAGRVSGRTQVSARGAREVQGVGPPSPAAQAGLKGVCRKKGRHAGLPLRNDAPPILITGVSRGSGPVPAAREKVETIVSPACEMNRELTGLLLPLS